MLAWFAETSLMAALLALVAWGAGRKFRLTPAARHAFWLAVLIKLVTPPLIHWPNIAPQSSNDTEAASSRWELSPASSESPVESQPDFWTALAEAYQPTGDSADGVLPGELDGEERDNQQPALSGSNEKATATLTRARKSSAPPSRRRDSPASSSWFVVDDVTWRMAERGFLAFCALGTFCMIASQAHRVFSFQRRLRDGWDAPAWMTSELQSLAERMGIQPPRIRVLNSSGSPFLWCLGRPLLVIPGTLLNSLSIEGWRGILAHELAHLRRGDPWVSRLTMCASWIWWWNPLFWLVRARLNAEAELACDALALDVCQGDRRAYALSLIDVCSHVSALGSNARGVVPALGVGSTGAGHFFERRLHMILQDQASHRPSLLLKLGVGLLALVAVPSWSAGQSAPVGSGAQEAPRVGRAERLRPPAPPLPPELPAEPEEAVEPQDQPAAPDMGRVLDELRDALQRGEIERARALVEKARAQHPEREARARLEIAKVRRLAEDARRQGVDVRARAEEQRHVAEARLREAQEQLAKESQKARELMEVRMREASEKLAKVRDVLKEKIESGSEDERRKLEKELRAAEDTVKREVAEGEEHLKLSLNEAMEQLKRAQSEVVTVTGRIRESEPRLAPPPVRVAPPGVRGEAPQPPVPPEGLLRRALRTPRGEVEIERSGPPPEAVERMEKRLNQLEQKFDAVMEEMRALRREMSGRGGPGR